MSPFRSRARDASSMASHTHTDGLTGSACNQVRVDARGDAAWLPETRQGKRRRVVRLDSRRQHEQLSSKGGGREEKGSELEPTC